MPIVFVHGVAVRDPQASQQTESLLRRFIAPVIAPHDPDHVAIFSPDWGREAGVIFHWDGASRPRSPLLGQGAGTPEPTPVEQAVAVAELPKAVQGLPAAPAYGAASGGLAPAGPSTGTGSAAPPLRLKDLTPAQLSDLLVTTLTSSIDDPRDQAHAVLAADAVAHDPITFPQLALAPDSASELIVLESLVAQRYVQEHAGDLAGQGVPAWLAAFNEHLHEAVDRGVNLPGFVLSRAFVEIRKPLNDFVTLFFGDVFTYLAQRGTAHQPGTIPTIVLRDLARARDNQQQRHGEPLVVLSHSMGGQIVYDIVTTFLPQAVSEFQQIRIDFWAATASQVGVFEEMKLFLSSSPAHSAATGSMVPFPDQRYLGGWWNVYDHNDVLSYTVHNIVADVNDEVYTSGLSVIHAHSGYLQRPSFFRAFAAKLEAAQAQQWRRP